MVGAAGGPYFLRMRSHLPTLIVPLSLVIAPACDLPAPVDPQEPVGACPISTSGPTYHSGAVTGVEIWSAAASPHIVEAEVEINAGGKVTIEPCAEVLIAEDRTIAVAYGGENEQGALIAEGTAERPIRFRGLDGAAWAGMVVRAPGTAVLRHVIIEGASGDVPWGDAALTLLGDAQLPVKRTAILDHVTIKDSGLYGVEVREMGGFADGSTGLVVTGSGKTRPAYPLLVNEHALDSIPPGQYTGNARDEIHLVADGAGVAGSGLQTDATIHDRGVPYVVGVDGETTLIVGGTLSGAPATLTIEPGVVMRFANNSALAVELFTTDEDTSTGILSAVGTPDKPIVFTSGADSPRPGDWQGIWFGSLFQPGSRVEHARIEYAGGDISSTLPTCNEPEVYSGGVILTAPPSEQFIKHTTFAHITGYGVLRGWVGPLAPDFLDTNTFEDLTACAQSAPEGENHACPDVPPACP